jgi:hypothetical protein
MRNNWFKFLMVVLISFITSSCYCSANKEEVQQKAPAKWEQQGFKVVDYEGFEWGLWFGGPYGGAYVWHRLKKIPDNGITYSGFMQMWGDELQVYGPKAVDAIRPK